MLNFWPYYIAQIWSTKLGSYDRVALFGAGEHTKWLLDLVSGFDGPEIVGLFDDRADCIPEFRGLRVVSPHQSDTLSFDAIVLSSDAAESTLWARAQECFPGEKIVRLYEGLPPGPYEKFSEMVPRIETIPGPSETINLDSVVAYASDIDTKKKLIELFSRLDPDPSIGRMVDGYRRGIDRFGARWRYIDLWSLLYAYTTLAQPKRYLEVGTRRGHSLAAVCAASMESGAESLEVVSCDLWIERYAGHPNPGPEFVKKQLERIGFQGSVRFLSGSSHELLPVLFQNTDEKFDLATVDGDHSRQGAMSDLEDVVGNIRLGGMLAFDDINHPQHPYLHQVWQRVLEGRQDFETYENPRNATGIAAAIRYR